MSIGILILREKIMKHFTKKSIGISYILIIGKIISATMNGFLNHRRL